MIRVTGYAFLRVPFSVDLDMTVEDFDDLSSSEQNELIDGAIDWKEACRSGELDDVEIDEADEIA